MSKHSANVFAFALISSLFLLTTAFRIPAHPTFSLPRRPYDYNYRDFHPSREGSGHFGALNKSITPWEVTSKPEEDESNNDTTTALESEAGSCTSVDSSKVKSFWLPAIEHQGTSPFLDDSSDYIVYRNVKDFGAKGDGTTDDSAAFNAAITDGDRCKGGNCGGTTGKPALVYIPPGTYSLSSTVQLLINTQIIGDAVDMPTLKASGSMSSGSMVVNGNDDGQPSTNNFYIGIRNVKIDTTAVPPDQEIYGLNWAVSQATNLINVHFRMPSGSQHVGIEMDGKETGGGSGLFMGDLTFTGGSVGILFSNQQYAIRNVSFTDVSTGILIEHVFALTLQAVRCDSVNICVDAGGDGTTGSLSMIDSSCKDCGTVVNGSSSFILENIESNNSGAMLKMDGKDVLKDDLSGKTYAVGHIHASNNGSVEDSQGKYITSTERGKLVANDGRYFAKSQPQYADWDASDISSVKGSGAKGDGQTDDTAAINAALKANANCKVTYFPHGVYVVTDTIHVPPGSRIVGEVWSTITASGSKFNSTSDPRALLRIGKAGDVGMAEVSDMLFTVSDILPGTILIEVNMAGNSPGDVSFHNTHTRIGGAANSRTRTACQSPTSPCKAAFMHAHLTRTSSSYWENNWLWTADHDLDGAEPTNIAVGRGMLISAQKGTWLLGTGSEHNVLYAFQLDNAQHVFASMQQVETPYWQPAPRAPDPWTPDAAWRDPTFDCEGQGDACYMSWHMRIMGSGTDTLALYGQAFWTFFFKGQQDCAGPDGTCQANSVGFQGLGDGGRNVVVYNLNTRGVYDLVRLETADGRVGAAQADNWGSWGGLVAAYLGYRPKNHSRLHALAHIASRVRPTSVVEPSSHPMPSAPCGVFLLVLDGAGSREVKMSTTTTTAHVSKSQGALQGLPPRTHDSRRGIGYPKRQNLECMCHALEARYHICIVRWTSRQITRRQSQRSPRAGQDDPRQSKAADDQPRQKINIALCYAGRRGQVRRQSTRSGRDVLAGANGDRGVLGDGREGVAKDGEDCAWFIHQILVWGMWSWLGGSRVVEMHWQEETEEEHVKMLDVDGWKPCFGAEKKYGSTARVISGFLASALHDTICGTRTNNARAYGLSAGVTAKVIVVVARVPRGRGGLAGKPQGHRPDPSGHASGSRVVGAAVHHSYGALGGSHWSVTLLLPVTTAPNNSHCLLLLSNPSPAAYYLDYHSPRIRAPRPRAYPSSPTSDLAFRASSPSTPDLAPSAVRLAIVAHHRESWPPPYPRLTTAVALCLQHLRITACQPSLHSHLDTYFWRHFHRTPHYIRYTHLHPSDLHRTRYPPFTDREIRADACGNIQQIIKEKDNAQEEKPKARRFAPEPVETTSKSSKTARKEAETGDLNAAKPRRFLPQPVETTTKSSRKRVEPETGDLSKPRRFAPAPVETSFKSSKDRTSQQDDKSKPRRFSPQPVESSSRSSRGSSPEKNDKPKPKSRFAPQPIETTQSSSKGRQQQGAPHIKFNLQTFETQSKSSSKPGEHVAPEEPAPGQEPKKPVRRFAPILLDTAQRSRRATDKNAFLTPANKTELGHRLAAKEHRQHITGDVTPGRESDSDTEMPDASATNTARDDQPMKLRPLSPLDGGHVVHDRFAERSHSFRCPELDTIESSESEQASHRSSVSSSPGQGSPITASDSSYPYPFAGFKDATRIRESVDENFHNYLLKLEAKRAEERMREAALAAFPNSDFHEPVMHYVDEEETESEHSVEDRPSTWEGHEDEENVQKTRRESTKISWEQLEMQRHAERMEQERKANQTTAKQGTKQPSQSAWWNPAAGFAAPDRDFKGMQDRARPPMLGDDIRFPRCRSPSPARFDVTQGSTALRNQMCYLTEHAESQAQEDDGEPHLWSSPKAPPKPHFTSIKTPKATVGSPSQEKKGLWGGFCAQDEGAPPGSLSPPPGGASGLLTPRFEPEGNPFEQSFTSQPAAGGVDAEEPIIKTPPVPVGQGLSNKELSSINSVLVSERDLDDTMYNDYPDSFITQVYNYLSLGYPSLARPFDAELSKISRFPISELRQDDEKAKQQPRGYIRLGPDFEGGGGEISEATCMRWQALKAYVREWARQEKNMVKTDGVFGNFAVGARRGSWAG
ncbi:hypothetical protein Q7P37_009298 [Cladosporium fusiforme]